MDMDYMIWPATFGNGVRTGMEGTIIVVHQLRIRQGRAQEQNAYGAGEGGDSILLTCVWHTETATLRLVGTIALAFVACQDPNKP